MPRAPEPDPPRPIPTRRRDPSLSREGEADPGDDHAAFLVDVRGRRGRRASSRVAAVPSSTGSPPPAPGGRPAPVPPPPRTEPVQRTRVIPQVTTPTRPARRVIRAPDDALPPTPPRPPVPGGSPTRHAPSRPARQVPWLRLVAGLLAVWLVFLVATPLHAWLTLGRVDTTPTGERPAAASGHTYVLVGSDSRAGLSAEERRRLGTGSTGGQRTDSILLVHVPSSGRPTLISIPRDSYLPIPGRGSGKVNAAYAMGGPRLLVGTLESATGLPIDGYAEIGFAGFAGVVDALGGVRVCVPFRMNDPRAHIDLQPGCQMLDGRTSLGYVRARYSDPRGDIGRAERQRQFLAAVIRKTATPATVLVPWRWWRVTHGLAAGMRVGEDTSLVDAGRLGLALRAVSGGDGLSLVVPLSRTNVPTSAGSAVMWDQARAAELFRMLRAGTPLTTAPPGTDGRPSGG